MMNTDFLSFGQRIDTENNLVELWLTHGALDEIKSMDLSDKNVIMFGGGRGNKWLSERCKNLVVIERDSAWLDNDGSYTTLYRPCNDSNGAEEMYCEIPKDMKFDVVINDDAYRFQVIEKALTMERPLLLITDNWMQSYVFMCPKGVELLKDFDSHIHEQSDHLDNDGVNKWKTAIHFIK